MTNDIILHMTLYHKFNEESKDFRIIWGELHNELCDLRTAIEKTQGEPALNQWLRRNFIRTLMSMIEGVSFSIRQIIIKRYESRIYLLESEDLIILNEKSISIKDNGEIKSNDIFHKTIPMFKYTFKLYSKLNNKEPLYEKSISNVGYNCFLETIDIRNRITHPKSGQSLEIKDKEYLDAEKANDWFQDFIRELFVGDLLEKQNS